ncbi:S24 family peptidase [Pseudomonas sp. NY15435]|uniref:LexA family transcriptional regulator n=1 Tax=Pseudomonas sp. NY15435 TaxID=3400358 RepID=UPI003A85F274
MVQSSNIRQAFVARLKQASASAGIPDWGLGARLADIAKVTPKAASKWLNMESMPGRSNMQAMASAFGVRVEWLEYGQGEMRDGAETPAPAAQAAKSSTADIVLKMLEKHGKGLTADARRNIVEAVEAEASATQGSNVIVADFSRPGPAGDEISIAHYDIRGAMGNGQVPADYPEMLRDVKVSQEQLRKLGVTFDDPNHLKMVYGWGHSMAPTIKHADPMIVNINIREFDGDGIFIFTWQGHLYIKRLQVQDAEHFEMISDNKQHKDRVIRMDETYIHARVLLVWNAHLV